MTPYSDVYDSFLSKITDFDLISMSTTDLENNMHKYMISACAEFTICKQDLTQRDDTNSQFNLVLTDLEVKIISTVMVTEWMNPFINSILMMRQFLSDSDYKTYSQSNHLHELQSLRSSNQEEVERLKGLYSYSGDLKSIFGSDS